MSFQKEGPREKGATERSTTIRPEGNFKRLSETEVQERRAKGLYLRCDERYEPSHWCKDRTLQVLMVCDEEGEEIKEAKELVEGIENLHLDVVEVSLNSVVEFTPNHTMKVNGQIGGQQVMVLIDSGATHNFISNRVVDRLGVKLEETSGLGVMMGTGKVEKSRGICRGVILQMQELQVVEDFWPLDLGSTDVILGMKSL